MKFSQMEYKRPDLELIQDRITKITGAMENADSFEAADEAFLAMDKIDRMISTQCALCYIRHSLDTRDNFYDEEMKFWNEALPKLQEYIQGFYQVTLLSEYKNKFSEKYGDVVFKNLEISQRTFSPDNISLMQEENDLIQEYNKLIANARVEFEGSVYAITQMQPFKTDSNAKRRLAAWNAEGKWFKENQKDLDRIYDRLVKLRDTMGKKLGHENFIELGYDRMGRNCYRKDDVEKFRLAVQKYIVPLALSIRKSQAQRLGMQYPLSFSDMAFEFSDGNPRPKGDEKQILKAGMKFYKELSKETGEFFAMMLENELLDVTSREGKEGGGYCEGIPDYKVPFIFANFNGTQGDVEVVTHEAGHAFAYYVNRNKVPSMLSWPSLEACEVHSMSMEFFAWPWAKEFFGADTEKYLYSHLASALTFIPYGTMVDHFQHEVYENPDFTPEQRHEIWKKLLKIYMPWVRVDGGIPFYAEGQGWQRQSHIYSSPFYYIDYCLAQTVSLEFWALIQNDFKNAWEKYMAYTVQGGSDVFTALLEKAGLDTPFDEDCLKKVAQEAAKWLENNSLMK